MNIYSVMRQEDDDVGYEEFYGFVCTAETEEQARHMHPYGHIVRSSEDLVESYDWPVTLRDLSVKLVGVATEDTLPGVILASNKGA